MKSKSSVLRICVVAGAVVIIAALCFAALFDNFGSSTANKDEIFAKAQKLRSEGDKAGAYYELGLYIQETSDNFDAYILMGDWCNEDGEVEKAYSYYQKAAKIRSYDENQLSINNNIQNFNYSTENLTIEVKPAAKYTRNMRLTIYNENLFPQQTESGKINGGKAELEADKGCQTTAWFDIDSKAEYLTMTGSFNCAIWQFCNESGLLTSSVSKGTFNNSKNAVFENKDSVTVKIPTNARRARVTYYDSSIEDTLNTGRGTVIQYGKYGEGYTEIAEQSFALPDLTENQTIVYTNGKWSLNDNGRLTDIGLEAVKSDRIMRVGISGDLCGCVTVKGNSLQTEKGDKSKIYGISVAPASGDTICKRLYASRGMSFDYKIDGDWVNGTGNDFDNAYPWCDMKLCNVSGKSDDKQTVTYSDDAKFSASGSNGNVMVEIPKFYVKREVRDGVENICISGEKHEGFSVEPVFVGNDGTELDYVYIGAYNGSEYDGKIISVAEKYPVLNIDYDKTLQMAEANGQGYSELSFLMVNALQKLFIVETGTLDASSIFAGSTQKLSILNSKEAVSLEDNEGANSITVKDTFYARKLVAGSSIAVFNIDEKLENDRLVRREVERVQINKNETFTVFFSGKPCKITKGKTAVVNVPEKAGKTDALEYCSSTLKGENGRVSFKYRGIENLYGDASIMLNDDAFVNDGDFNFRYEYGSVRILNGDVAEHTADLSNQEKANAEGCINSMLFDEQNPLVLVPTKTGNGASAYSSYCDSWIYKRNEDNGNTYFVYGGADNDVRFSGIFQLKAVINQKQAASPAYSSRIMYR